MATTPWNRVGNYRYRTEDKLGQGQFGTVYKARSVDDGGYVAIKFLSAEPEFRSQDEIDALHTLSREKAAYVVRLLEWRSMAGGSVALVFELADGSVHDLLQRMEFVKGFPAPLVIQLYYQLSTALNFIASKDLVHRDLKPGNVLYWNLPANGFLFKLGDFGGARSASIEMRSLIGTVGYA
uniref:IkappaB kinase n=1 Tax=Steinernema glaseri TaxID=37863 RepID=A0A1I7XY01_9BILA